MLKNIKDFAQNALETCVNNNILATALVLGATAACAVAGYEVGSNEIFKSVYNATNQFYSEAHSTSVAARQAAEQAPYWVGLFGTMGLIISGAALSDLRDKSSKLWQLVYG